MDQSERSPAEVYDRFFVPALFERWGGIVAHAFRAPYAYGDAEALLAWCREAGIPDAVVTRQNGTVRFPSIEVLVSTERARAWTLGGLLYDEQLGRLRAAASETLRPFETPEGGVACLMPALIVTSTWG
jgi:hypothetical protein